MEAPLGEFSETLYLKRCKRSEPEQVLPLAEQTGEMRRKQTEKQEGKYLRPTAAAEAPPETETPGDWHK